jgi:hypothetical protein
MIGWLFDVIPWWVYLGAGIAVAAMTYPMWSTVWLWLPRPVKAVIILIGTAGLAYFAGRNRGFKNARDRQKEADAQATNRRLETNAEVDRMPAADRDKSLDRWMRD